MSSTVASWNLRKAVESVGQPSPSDEPKFCGEKRYSGATRIAPRNILKRPFSRVLELNGCLEAEYVVFRRRLLSETFHDEAVLKLEDHIGRWVIAQAQG